MVIRMRFFKKITFLALALTLSLSLIACSENGDGGEDSPDDGAVFGIVYNNVEIVPGGDMARLRDALGEPGGYFEAASCAFDGLDKTFTYGSLRISTYPDGDKDRISMIVLLDDGIATPEGVTIGSPRSEVIAAYGEDYEGGEASLTYRRGGTLLRILFGGGAVSSVQYHDAGSTG